VHKAAQWGGRSSRGRWEKELTGRDAEPSELIYFKVYKSQAPVIEQTIDTAALMLGSDRIQEPSGFFTARFIFPCSTDFGIEPRRVCFSM